MDLRFEEQVDHAINKTIEKFGTLDILGKFIYLI